MKIRISSRALFALGFVILAATNIVVLSGVASNRSGNPETLVTLTERELQLPYRVHEENSGLSLRLVWRTLGKNEEEMYDYSGWKSPAWFSAEKLDELGFKTDGALSSDDNGTHYRKPIPKEVFIVLENNDETYRDAIKIAEKVLEKAQGLFKSNSGDKTLRNKYESAEKRLKKERMENSRLFAIDAGLYPGELRNKYKDRARFIIVKGLVKPRYRYHKKKKEMFGVISRLSTERIHVPLKHRNVLDNILAQDKPKQNGFQSPRYEIKLAYGSRLEPWIVSVHHMEDKSN